MQVPKTFHSTVAFTAVIAFTHLGFIFLYICKSK